MENLPIPSACTNTLNNTESKDLINKFLKATESQYYKKQYIIYNNHNTEKIKSLYDFISSLTKQLETISLDEFNSIRNYAITNGGFITMENRRVLYQKILDIQTKNSELMVYIDEIKYYEAKKKVILDNYKLNIFNFKRKNENYHENSSMKTISNDVNRSKLFTFLERNKECQLMIPIIKEFELFIVSLCSWNDNVYNYYQGYHDIGLYFYLLFFGNSPVYFPLFQRFTEFNWKMYMQQSNEDFPFMNCWIILKHIITLLSPKTQEFLNKATEDGFAFFAASWILSWFTHNINNICIAYRLLDYFIVSHSVSVYYISAIIIIDQINKNFLTREFGTLGYNDVFLFFQEYDFDTLDFDKYVIECEQMMKEYPASQWRNFFESVKIKEYFSLANKESYILKWVMYLNQQKLENNVQWYIQGRINVLKEWLGFN